MKFCAASLVNMTKETNRTRTRQQQRLGFDERTNEQTTRTRRMKEEKQIKNIIHHVM